MVEHDIVMGQVTFKKTDGSESCKNWCDL